MTKKLKHPGWHVDPHVRDGINGYGFVWREGGLPTKAEALDDLLGNLARRADEYAAEAENLRALVRDLGAALGPEAERREGETR